MTRPADPSRSAAIVGIGLRFPSGLSTTDAFWRFLMEGGNAIGEIPADRMEMARLYDPEPATPGRIMTRFGAYLDGIDTFDAGFFGISPREAERMDPNQRLVLETAWEAIEDAGLDAEALKGRSVGVYVGQWLSDFEARLMRHVEKTDFEMTTGSGRYTTPGRLSYFLGLNGPSIALDTACSSSLTAVHLAMQGLRNGDCEAAFVSGVNVILSPHITIGYSQSRMMAPDGQCKFGDASGDGYVRSEGAATLLIKRLDRALEDGDTIHAVIRGSAINNDGRGGQSLGTPSRAGQAMLIRRALDDAQLDPREVGYVEAHGTGTRSGDPVELGAIGEVLGRGRNTPLPVGSVKTNIGHTEGAAGMAGLIKAAFAVKLGRIPASRNLTTPNPDIDWEGDRVTVPTEARDFDTLAEARIASVSGFGIAGSNGHVILQSPPEASAAEAKVPALTGFAPVLPVSATGESALLNLAGSYAELSTAHDPRDLASAAALRRGGLRDRAVIAATSGALAAFAKGEGPAIQKGSALGTPRIVFVAPGQGGQWDGMARGLLANAPAFRASIEACDAAISELTDWSLIEQLTLDRPDPNWKFDRIEVIQPALVALAVSYAALWREMGIRPDAVIGHSMGEVAAAAVSGALTIPDAMRIVVGRSRLMAETRGQGGMALVELVDDAFDARLKPYEGKLSLGARNGPRSSVVSGETAALDQFLAEVEADGIFCRRIKVDVASHSPQMQAASETLVTQLEGLTPGASDVPMISTVRGAPIEGAALDAGYWGRNLRQPVLFDPAVRAALGDGPTLFIELGPHPVLLPSLEDIGQDAGARIVSTACGTRDVPDADSFASAAAAAWVAGAPLDWSALYAPAPEDTPLPAYPWQRKRHWVEEAEIGATPATDDLEAPTAEAKDWLYHTEWRAAPLPEAGDAGAWCIAHDRSRTPLAEALQKALTDAGATARLAPLSDATASDGEALAVLPGPGADAAFLPVSLLQRFESGTAPAQVVYVTSGAAALDAGTADADHAALWGAARVVAAERPDVPLRLIDADDPTQVADLARYLMADTPEDQAALTADGYRVARLVRGLAQPATGPLPWRRDAACLITGGLGGVGTLIAKRMAAEGARHLVMLGRTTVPPRADWGATEPDSPAGRRIAAICEIEAAGASVHYIPADASDADAMRAALDTYRAERRPEIRAVIHATGAARHAFAARMTAEDFSYALRPKLEGARVLDALFDDLDLFVVFSSLAATLNTPGTANYAAANAGVEALAEARRLRGQPALSVAWGMWPGVGLLEADSATVDMSEIVRQGARTLVLGQAEAVFSLVCRSGRSAAVFDMDWAEFAADAQGAIRPYFSEVASAEAATASPSDFLETFAAKPPEARLAAMADLVRASLASVLGLAPGDIHPDVPFGSLGMNSLMAMELRTRMEASLSCRLPATMAWNYPTLTALSRHLTDRLGADDSIQTQAQDAQQASDTGFSLDDMIGSLETSSDDDIAALFRREG